MIGRVRAAIGAGDMTEEEGRARIGALRERMRQAPDGDQGQQGRPAPEVTPEVYDGAMKAMRDAVGEVRDQISAQDASGLEASSATITSSLARVMIYWRSQRDRVAYGIADTAMGAGRRLQAAAAAGDFGAAGTAFGELRESCTPCHEQYRERDADGNWQIKARSQ